MGPSVLPNVLQTDPAELALMWVKLETGVAGRHLAVIHWIACVGGRPTPVARRLCSNSLRMQTRPIDVALSVHRGLAHGHGSSHPSYLCDCWARCVPGGVARLSSWICGRAQACNAASFFWPGFQALERICQSHPRGTGTAITMAAGHNVTFACTRPFPRRRP